VTEETPSVFVTERSAEAVTVSVSDAVLFALFGSETADVAEAVLVWLPVVEAGTVYPTVTVALPPETIVPIEHEKSGPDPMFEQVPCDGVTVPRVKPVGQVSVTEAPVASDGPVLATVIV
jgi:hypothetical protein